MPHKFVNFISNAKMGELVSLLDSKKCFERKEDKEMMGCRENRPALGLLGQITIDFILFHKKR